MGVLTVTSLSWKVWAKKSEKF